MGSDDNLSALNSCPYIFLVSHEEAPDCLDLRIVVQEARAEKELSPIKTGDAKIDKVLGRGHAITSEPNFRTFTITFENYVGFSIRSESYVEPEPEEDFSRKLRSHSRSAFLDFIQKSTFADQVLDEPILHYSVVCLDHVIDVACTALPIIECQSIAESQRAPWSG
ncbi:hypothetical protein [Roseibium sediminis]|uniref:hypothetical protein n=1 Tax=Roseibium sediminis TaxID=1775174 RepID=UPI00123CC4E2|nr:hypothetical protein [Roseibium sediminis]